MPLATEAELRTASSAGLEAFFRSLLAQFGLESLAGFAAEQATQGVGEAEFISNLENQEAYREQFRPIFERRAAGLPSVTPQEVLSFRRQIAQLEQFYELPSGTIDPDQALVNDRSYNEIQSEVAFVAQLRDEEDPAVIEELLGAGASSGTILAFGLNREVALGALQEQVRVARISVGASRGGFELTGEEAAALEDAGLSPQDVQTRAATLATAGDIVSGVGGEFGGLERQTQIDVLAGSGLAIEQFQRRARQLASRFEGGGGFLRGNTGERTGLGSA